MKFVFYHIKDDRNIGDQASCPADYFAHFNDCERRSIKDWEPDRNAVSIFGGGGLLYHELHDILHAAALARKTGNTGPIVIWGAGENMHNQKSLLSPAYLDAFDLVGLRDCDHPYVGNHFVPCASCLAPEFAEVSALPSSLPVVVYEHYQNPIPLNYWPKADNSSETGSFRDKLKFLAAGEIVVTNSYHGAYWAGLIGRSVVIVRGPESSRFHHFQVPFPVVDAKDVVINLSRARCCGARHTYMNHNLEFEQKVSRLIES